MAVIRNKGNYISNDRFGIKDIPFGVKVQITPENQDEIYQKRAFIQQIIGYNVNKKSTFTNNLIFVANTQITYDSNMAYEKQKGYLA